MMAKDTRTTATVVSGHFDILSSHCPSTRALRSRSHSIGISMYRGCKMQRSRLPTPQSGSQHGCPRKCQNRTWMHRTRLGTDLSYTTLHLVPSFLPQSSSSASSNFRFMAVPPFGAAIRGNGIMDGAAGTLGAGSPTGSGGNTPPSLTTHPSSFNFFQF